MSSDDEAKDARIEELEWELLEWEGRAIKAEERLAQADLRIRVLQGELQMRWESIARLQRELERARRRSG